MASKLIFYRSYRYGPYWDDSQYHCCWSRTRSRFFGCSSYRRRETQDKKARVDDALEEAEDKVDFVDSSLINTFFWEGMQI